MAMAHVFQMDLMDAEVQELDFSHQNLGTVYLEEEDESLDWCPHMVPLYERCQECESGIE